MYPHNPKPTFARPVFSIFLLVSVTGHQSGWQAIPLLPLRQFLVLITHGQWVRPERTGLSSHEATLQGGATTLPFYRQGKGRSVTFPG